MKPIPHTSQRAAFPLGGIGTGNVSLGARGELRDWEFENGPDKGRDNPFSFFAIYAKPVGAPAVTRVLEAQRVGRHDWQEGYPFNAQAGLPRLRRAWLRGRYPVATIDFEDETLPVNVQLCAFTPLVPLDEKASGIPSAVLRYRVTNPTKEPIAVTVAGSLSHTAGRGEGPYGMRAAQNVQWRDDGSVRGLDFGIDLPRNDFGYGTMSLTTTDDSITAKPQWVSGYWPDGPRLFWNDLVEDGLLEAEEKLTLEDRPRSIWAEWAQEGKESYTEAELMETLPRIRTGSLGIVHTLEAGESRDFEFALSWSFPNRRRAWCGKLIADNSHADEVVLNQYATWWPTAWDAAAFLHENLDMLESATEKFTASLHESNLPEAIADAVAANIATLRSTTCFVLDSPNPQLGPGPVFAAWEGSFDHAGSCEGTCTHVWSYAQTVAWLFPALEQSARRVEYLLETDEEGAQKFRSNRVFGSKPWFMGPAVDGQLGTFIRLHREWRHGAGDEFLRELWPAARRSLQYAIKQWDRDGDGLLDGELHNTYDIEFYGIEPLANGMFLTALRAGANMASYLGETHLAADWLDRAARASEAMDSKLWNGSFYHQLIDNVDANRYQYGRGVLSDQLLGQFHAYLAGLGENTDPEHVRSALSAIMEHNFRPTMWAHESTQRTYALGDEGGLLLASWPQGGRPRIPFVYSDEVWTGIEHHVAATMLYAGLNQDAIRIEEASRARYTGEQRNPWDEIECGNHYARSLSSWALLLAASGAQWDAPSGVLSFSPAIVPLRCFFSTDTAWGTVEVDDGGTRLRLDVLGGKLVTSRIELAGALLATNVTVAAGNQWQSPQTLRGE